MRIQPENRPRQAIAIVAFALLVLATVRSDLLLEYAYDLPVNGFTERIVLAAEAWNAFTGLIGVNAVTAAVVEGMDRLRGTDNGL